MKKPARKVKARKPARQPDPNQAAKSMVDAIAARTEKAGKRESRK